MRASTPATSPAIQRPVDANLNDDNNPRVYSLPKAYSAGTKISVRSRSWVKKSSCYSGTSNRHWKSSMTVDSYSNSHNVRVLRDGDPVPDVPGFNGQSGLAEFIESFIVDDHIVLDDNQAIMLIELGTTNSSSSAFDLQDLVLLITLTNED